MTPSLHAAKGPEKGHTGLGLINTLFLMMFYSLFTKIPLMETILIAAELCFITTVLTFLYQEIVTAETHFLFNNIGLRSDRWCLLWGHP